MKPVSRLPEYLVTRYKNWKVSGYLDRKEIHEQLADEGQKPKVMVISCCDSRLHVTSIFGAETGEFFIHRNIANQVPPYQLDDAHHGTSAAIEFAVTTLKVEHLIIMGHSQCGGVRHCHDTCQENTPAAGNSFVDRWMDILRPGYERVKHISDTDQRVQALEHMGVVLALENLAEFPFIREAISSGQLTMHGLWHNIRDGGLMGYNPDTKTFEDFS